jgi:ACS family tartrate transporter-like MFS transporter
MERAAVLSSLRRKVVWRLIAPLTFLIFLSSLDRSNISIAALQMNGEIGLSPEMYGRGAGLFFFVGYILLQYPHTAILRRIHARRWVSGTVVIWGVAASLMAFIRTPEHFYGLRFLLGVAEGGFSPGATFLAALWMPRRFRAAAVGATMLAIPLSQVIGAPVSGWLMTLPFDVGGLSRWRLMIATEGALTIIGGAAAWFVFVDRLADASWLTTDEKALAAEELARDASERGEAGSSLGFLANARLWAAAAVWFCLLAGAQGIIFWMAQVVKQISGGDPFQVGLITALPWVGVALGMVLNARSSDRSGERHAHLAAAAALGAVCLLLAFLIPPGFASASLLVLGGIGLGGAQGVFWPIPIGLLSRDDTGRGITVLNMVGNTAGLIMTPLIGLIRQRTGQFGPSIYLLTAVIALAALITLGMRVRTLPGDPASAHS